MRISDWSSDVCLPIWRALPRPARTRDRAAQSARMGAHRHRDADRRRTHGARSVQRRRGGAGDRRARRPAARKAALDAREGAYAMKAVGRTGEARAGRSEEHTSELQSLMRISYAVFCLKKKT